MKHRIVGVYQITNIVNGKRYIGSSEDVETRLYTHGYLLSVNRHHNSHLQNSFNKYGKDSFEYRTILVCDPKNRIFYEQLVMDGIHPEYNIRTIADSPIGVKKSEKEKREISERMRRRKHPPTSPETRAKIGNALRGIPLSEETKRKLSIAKKGVPKPAGFGEKMFRLVTGRKLSEAHKEKIRIKSKEAYDAGKHKNLRHPIHISTHVCPRCGAEYTRKYEAKSPFCNRCQKDRIPSCTKEDVINRYKIAYDLYINGALFKNISSAVGISEGRTRDVIRIYHNIITGNKYEFISDVPLPERKIQPVWKRGYFGKHLRREQCTN